MKIAPLAKIAAARKRLIERPKETKMKKIDVDALWDEASGTWKGEYPSTRYKFARLIIEECAKQADEMAQTALNMSLHADYVLLSRCAAAIRALKP